MEVWAISFAVVCLLTTYCWAEESVVMPGLQVGDMALDFSAPNYEGSKVILFDELEKGPVVLVFYRGGWCMYCNKQLHELQSRLNDFKAQGASIIALSVDQVKKASETVEKKSLGFNVISNPGADILEEYGLTYRVPDELAVKYKKEYKIDLEEHSGEAHHTIAIPATYVISPEGTIVYAYANEDYKIRSSIDDVIASLKELN